MERTTPSPDNVSTECGRGTAILKAQKPQTPVGDCHTLNPTLQCLVMFSASTAFTKQKSASSCTPLDPGRKTIRGTSIMRVRVLREDYNVTFNGRLLFPIVATSVLLSFRNRFGGQDFGPRQSKDHSSVPYSTEFLLRNLV